MADNLLPDPFENFEPFASTGALATEAECNRKRLASTMEEIQAFDDAMLPRMEAVLEYLSRFPLDKRPEGVGKMPADTRRLFCLALSLAEVATASARAKWLSKVEIRYP